MSQQTIKSMTSYLVEELHEDKGVEDKGVMLGGALHAVGTGHPKHLIPKEHQPVHHSQLEHTLPHNVLGHLRNNALFNINESVLQVLCNMYSPQVLQMEANAKSMHGVQCASLATSKPITFGCLCSCPCTPFDQSPVRIAWI